MSDIPTECWKCGGSLEYKADSPNKLEGHIVKWVCNGCYKEEGKPGG